MHNRRTTPNPATSFLFLALAALVAGWLGCSASGSTHVAGGTGGTGGSTVSGKGGGGGTGGGDAGSEAGPTCSATEKVCNGVCVSIDDPKYGCSPMYCTACGSMANAGTTCAGGNCVLGACNMGFADCDKDPSNGCETDTTGDPNNCGVCSSQCMLSNATSKCVAGKCQVDTCKTGRTDCDMDPTNGCEADLQNDPQNCGMCGKACTSPETCEMGKCGLYCPKGKADCDMMVGNGCETPLGTNTDCNFCGDTCNLANSNSQCTQMGNSWVCNLNMCNPGFANCDMIANTGCETNTQNDPNNCNSCGNQCPYGPHSTPLCTGGVCGIACDNGYADCDNNPGNGCEVHIDGDNQNCGMCGKLCSTNHATEACVAGVCKITACASGGWTDCDVDASDGCEVNNQTDPNNCSMCGTICKTQNGTPACNQGMCAVGSCNSGWAHCPGQPGTNCETSTANDPNNCGACGAACSTNHDAPSCSSGMCILACAPLFGDCDNMVATGCETGLTTVAHCGACGTQCTTLNGTPACNVVGMTASCGVAGCSAGYANCPGDANDCKTFIGGSDVNNCGGCGVKCTTLNGTPVCNGGVCGVGSCNAGFAHCPGQPGNNCETNILGNDPNNCGACNNACSVACGGAAGHVTSTVCTAGTCSIPAGGCSVGFEDFDKTCSDGCECKDSTNGTTCGAAHALTLNLPVTSNVFPAAPNAAFFSVTFSGNTLVTWHPKVTLSDPLNEFVMDITSDCSTALTTCPDHAATGITTWETSYGGPNPAADPNSQTAGGVSNFQAIPLPGTGGTIYIKVYRKVAMTSCNNSFTLTATQ